MLGTPDQRCDKLAITHHIQLKPERVGVGGLRDGFDGANAHGRQGKWHPRFLRSLGRENFAIRMHHACEACRCNRQRHAHCLPHHPGGGTALSNVHRHTLAKLQTLERCFVRTVGIFGPRTRVDIVIKHARHTPPRNLAQVFDAGKFGHEKYVRSTCTVESVRHCAEKGKRITNKPAPVAWACRDLGLEVQVPVLHDDVVSDVFGVVPHPINKG